MLSAAEFTMIAEAESEEEALKLIEGRPLSIDKDEEDVKVASAKLKQ